MSKKFFTIIVVCVLSMLSAVPAMAQEWLVDPNGYEHTTANEDWLYAEALAELKQWTDARKDAILALPDEAQRYDAIVKTVCDFLEYDIKYVQPYISYTLRDGKGVCADYTTLTKALCDAVGIKCDIVLGIFANDAHDWLKVTILGKEYYSDVTQVDAGMPAYKLSSVLWSDHTEENVVSDIRTAIFLGGRDIGEVADSAIAVPIGYVECVTKDGRVYYITEEDAAAEERGELTLAQIHAKYGIN